MPTIVTGPNSVLRMDLLDLDFDGDTIATATHIHVEYDDGWYNDFYGSFVYDEFGDLVGGTLTGISYTVDGNLVYQLSDFSIDVVTFLAYVDAEDYEGLKALILAGNDSITGAGGNDWLEGFAGDDVLTGNGGADTLIGGSGDDSYYVDADGDVTIEQAGGGADTIYAATDYNLGLESNIENGVLLGTGDFVLTGNELANNMVGNSGANLIDGWDGDDVISGAGGDDVLFGWRGNDIIDGGDGADFLFGEEGADTLTGGAGADAFVADAQIAGGTGLSGDTITDFGTEDRIILRGSDISTFSFSFSGTTLTYNGGSITLLGAAGAHFAASAASQADGGGVQIVMTTAPPPPPPPPRAALTLTQPGQDFIIGGDVLVYGTTASGEVIEIMDGDVLLDASFNLGGDTVVLPGNAGSYAASLSGSFVTIVGGGITVSIPVGTAGLNVQFADSTRNLRFETTTSQVMLGNDPVTSAAEALDPSGPALVEAVIAGPGGLGRLVLGEPGQDIDIGGDVSIFGSTAPGETVTILDGTVQLDASFNVGGDTVALPGSATGYTATLSGSFVTIAGGGISVSIPVGIAGLTVDFADVDLALRYDTTSGQVMLGDQPVTSDSPWDYRVSGKDLTQLQIESHRMEASDSFSFG